MPRIPLCLVALILAAGCAHAKPAKVKAPVVALPSHVEEVDALKLKLIKTEAEKQVLIRTHAQQSLDEAGATITKLEAEYNVLVKMLAEKYKIDTSKDRFDEKTLAITRVTADPKK